MKKNPTTTPQRKEIMKVIHKLCEHMTSNGIKDKDIACALAFLTVIYEHNAKLDHKFMDSFIRNARTVTEGTSNIMPGCKT